MNEAALENARQLRRAGRLSEAAQIYGEILRGEPNHFEALHVLGIIRYQAGDLEQAEGLIAKAVKANPQSPDALYNHGSLLLKMDRPVDALDSFDRALAIRPNYLEALGNRGNTYSRLGRLAEAFADFEKFTVLKPEIPEGWTNLGGALMKALRYEEAAVCFGKALALRPNYPEARRHRGAIWFKLKRFADALQDADQALAFNAKNADAWEQKADALGELDRQEEALAAYHEAIALKPDAADAVYNRANVLMSQRRPDDAARDYARVLQLNPDYHYARGNLVFCKLGACDWNGISEHLAAVSDGLRAGMPVSPPFQSMVVSADEGDVQTATRMWSAHGYPPSEEPLWRGEIYAHDRIRIAYLSANFHDHAVARQLAGVFEHHDRRRFAVYAFSFGPNDNGPMRARLSTSFEQFIDIRSKSADEIAHMLRQMEIDIAIDLMGYTEASRPAIMTYRATPIQVNYLGYPGTMGTGYFDYLLADRFVIPPNRQEFYDENIAYLPHSYMPCDDKRIVAEARPERAEAGLPDSGFVFCCFNNNYKFSPQMFDIWMNILRGVDGSVLWLSRTNDRAMENLRKEALSRSVSPDRLIFAPYVLGDGDHLARLSLADLFLDTLPYNAHASACDALWVGVPVLSCSGSTFAGRVGASLLASVGMAELIAPSLEAYEVMALNLAIDPGAMRGLKSTLAANRLAQPLFDTAAFTRALESAYVTMWKRQQDGGLPEPFAVEGIG